MSYDLTEKFLNKIPKQYRSNISIIYPEKGGNSKIEYTHPVCGCKTTSILKTFVKRKSFDSCAKCSRQKDVKHYQNQVPFENVKLLEPFRGGSTKIEFKHIICGCITKTTLTNLSNRDQFEFCKKCYQSNYHNSIVKFDNVKIVGKNKGYNSNVDYTCPKCNRVYRTKLSNLANRKDNSQCLECSKKETLNKYLSKLSKNVLNRLKILNYNGSYSRVRYSNLCGHETESTISDFLKRDQFENCQHCAQKKSALDYINPKYESNIQVLEDLGAESSVIYTCPSCGTKRKLKIRALKNYDSCLNCDNQSRLSKDEMINRLSPYLNNINISKGFPGHRTTVITGNCGACGSKVENYYFNLSRYYLYHDVPRCNSCSPKSIEQKMLADFVGSLTKINQDDRSVISGSNLEIDIFCPKEKFAIEYNGLIWHSEKYGKDRNYHFHKTKQCQKRGVYLLHVWSDKYKKYPEIYHSIINHRLGKTKTKVFARKCLIKELDKSVSRDFFNTNHLDGNVGCIKAWGLFYDDELLQAISVRRVSKQNSKYNGYLEIARMATALNCAIIGGESKLLNIVEKFARENKYVGILNYVSADFGNPVLSKQKLEYIGVTDVSYCYTDGNKRISRQRLQERPKGMSERDYAASLSLYRINLTPNFIYKLDFK